jgi:hypothetical protein
MKIKAVLSVCAQRILILTSRSGEKWSNEIREIEPSHIRFFLKQDKLKGTTEEESE